MDAARLEIERLSAKQYLVLIAFIFVVTALTVVLLSPSPATRVAFKRADLSGGGGEHLVPPKNCLDSIELRHGVLVPP